MSADKIDQSTQKRSEIIKSVTTPLGFFVLCALIIEALLGGLAVGFKDYRFMLIVSIIIFLAALIVTVLILATFRPEALQGQRPWHHDYPESFAEDLYLSLEGILEDLPTKERDEAWATISDVLERPVRANKDYQLFCKQVSNRITMRVATLRDIQTRRKSRAT